MKKAPRNEGTEWVFGQEESKSPEWIIDDPSGQIYFYLRFRIVCKLSFDVRSRRSRPKRISMSYSTMTPYVATRVGVVILLWLCLGHVTAQNYVVTQENQLFELEESNPVEITVVENGYETIPIPFTFQFFGNSYNECHVANNGFIQFSTTLTGGCCAGQSLPDPASPNNLIAAAWTSNNPTQCCSQGDPFSNYYYETFGTAPNRRFTILFIMLDACGASYVGQVKLFEGSNIIEIHTDAWALTDQPCNNTTQGIENIDGTAAYYLSGRNANTTWYAVDDVVRFTPIPPPSELDVSVTSLLSPGFNCEEVQDVSVVVTNTGTDTIEDLTINWELNGAIQPPGEYEGVLLPNGDTIHVLLGTLADFSGTPDTLKVWATDLNGEEDMAHWNDTLDVIYHLPMGGTYTIGGTSPDFPTIMSAVNALSTSGVCEPVTFMLRNGIYNEQVVIPAIPGASATNDITFTSESGDSSAVTIQFNATSTQNYIMRIDDATHLRFTHLGFKTVHATYSNLIQLVRDCSHITFERCKFEGRGGTGTPNSYLAFCDDAIDGNITFNENYFLNGTHGIIFVGNSGPVARINTIDVTGNRFLNQRSDGMWIQNARNVTIARNSLITNTNIAYNAIVLTGAHGNNSILNNRTEASVRGDGIAVSGINQLDGFDGICIIANNMSSLVNGYGMELLSTNHTYVYHNSVNCLGTDPANNHAVRMFGGDSLTLKNNIFMANSGKAIDESFFTTNLISDYNVLVTSGTVLAERANINYANLATWQAGTFLDTNSLSLNPQFVSNSNLHVLSNQLNATGTPVGVIADYDGEPRDLMLPDIGADEIGANVLDIGVFSALPKMPFHRGEQDIKAVIRNYGGIPVETAVISWKLNGVPQQDYHYFGAIQSLAHDTVVIGQVNFALNSPYTIEFNSHTPNGMSDSYAANDTFRTGTIYPGVSGEIIVGPTGEILTLANAVNAMTTGGVVDSVHFRIQSGTYHASIVIPHSTLLTCATPVVFESETGNAADVVWDNQSTGTHTVVLNGADGITFRNLTIKSVVGNLAAFRVLNASTCNVVEFCVVQGVAGGTAPVIEGVSTNALTYNHNNTIRNNAISNGNYNVYWHGFTGTSGIVVSDNTLHNAQTYGLYMIRVRAPLVANNTVTTNSGIAVFNGMNFDDCNENVTITGNQILLHGRRANGIYMQNSDGIALLPVLLSNNYIILGNGASSNGIMLSNNTHTNIHHNTIRISGGANTGVNIRRTNGSDISILNNILDNQALGQTLFVTGSATPFTSDYNAHYTEGANLISYLATNYANLAAWQATGRDLNSIHEEPIYEVEAPLGYAITNSAMNNMATPLSAVTLDIEKMPRSNSTPDIGCDEYDLFTHDVGLLSIAYPYQPFPVGINTVYVKFINNGEDTLTSMQVNWEVNDTLQPTYIWSGLLPSAGTYDSLDIGQFDFVPGMYHKIKVWVSDPNGMQDELATNDTLIRTNLYPGLSGVYTIGGDAPDFETLSDAVTELNRGGAADDVLFNIRPGTYLDTLKIKDFPGSDCSKTVTFQSETGDRNDVLITNLGFDAFTITLDGADGITFRDLSIESVNPAYRHAIYYYNSAHCNQFLDNLIEGYEGTATDAGGAVILSPAGVDTAIVFSGNTIRHGSYGLHLNGGSTWLAHTVIANNTIEYPRRMGVYAISEYGMTIDKNVINLNVHGNNVGVELVYCHQLKSVSGNNCTLAGGGEGIALADCDNTSGAPGIIANNFINIGGHDNARGIDASGSAHLHLVHNNIHVYSTDPTYYRSTALSLSSNPSLVVKNTIAVHTGPGPAIISNSNTNLTANHNVYYVAGDYIGYLNGGAVADLATWQAATGQDAMSLSLNPQFMSESDLHVSNVLLNGAGESLSTVTTDIDGDTRNNPPDIGADEFDPALANDAGVFMWVGPVAPFAHGSQPVSVAIKNYGADTLESVNVRWLVNGLEQPVYHWTGSLLSAQCDTVIIGNYSFAAITEQDFILWTEAPNGIQDSTHVNDTLEVDDVYPALAGTYTVGGVLPHFNLFSQLEKALDKGGILDDVTFMIRNGTYETQFAIRDFPRTSYTDSVIFTAESGDSSAVIVERNFASSDNYTVLLLNARGIRFEKMTLKSTKGIVAEVTAGSRNVRFANCHLSGVDLVSDNGHYAVINSATTTEDSIVITNNLIEEGDYGIYLIGSSGNPEHRMTISGNTFLNNRTASIYSRYTHGIVIQDNKITNNESSPGGILIYDAVASPVISGNDIRLLNGGSYGILLQRVSGSAMLPAKVFNNYVFARNDNNHSTTGIAQYDCDYIQHDYHTVRLESGSGSICFFDQGSLHHTHVRNCNFANIAGGKAMHTDWTDFYSSNTVNYCNLYTSGPTLAYFFINYPDLEALQNNENQNLQGVSEEPLFADNEPSVFQAALDGAATPISGISEDIYGLPRHATAPDIGAREFTLPAHDIGIKLLVAPVTYCGLSDTARVTVRIQNYGANAETAFDVAYSFDGGAWVTENVDTLSIAPGQYADYTFTSQFDLSAVGSYTFDLTTDLVTDLNPANDTLRDNEVIHIPALVSGVSNMLPAHQSVDVDKPVSLSWSPAADATRYDVYLWEDGDPEPMSPAITGIQQINTNYSNVEYGETYNWKVVARNTCDQSVASPVQQFMVRNLPDLLVDTVIAPASGFTGQPIEVEWVVRNSGTGVTGAAQWSDAVYLSADATLNTGLDVYLGAVQNLTALEEGEEYQHAATFTIPNNTAGNYYVFVYSDRYSNVIEASNNNNWSRSPAVAMIQLSPLPDLRVVEVVPPLLAFSGEVINVQYTVENNGSAPTGLKTWKDRVIFSASPVNPDGSIIGTFNRTMNLGAGADYTETVQVTLPEGVFGEYYLYVHTDATNTVYEFAAEANNVAGSDTFDVLLSPPPDLVMTQINIADTISSDYYNVFGWTVSNAGAGSTESSNWKDEIYISPAPVFNPNFNKYFAHKYQTQQVGSLSDYNVSGYSASVKLPAGHYYIYGVTDVTNKVYEYNKESNNQYTLTGQIYVGNTDLMLTDLSQPDTVQGAEHFNIGWNQYNAGYGQFSNKNVKTRIYGSNSPVFDPEEASLLRELIHTNQAMLPGDTIARTTSLHFPPSLYGDVFLYLHINPDGWIYEATGDSNNVYSATQSIFVIEPPVPDLEITSVEVPDTVSAGVAFSFGFTTTNTGTLLNTQSWVDSAFISFDSVWTPEHALQLSGATQSSDLEIAASFHTSFSFRPDAGMQENVYYIYVFTDADDDVYEGSGETNNVFRSEPFYLKGAPVVDLAIDTVIMSPVALMSGTNYPLSWTMTLETDKIPVVQQWYDRAFLSPDQILSPLSDIPVGVYSMAPNAAFLPGAPFTREAMISIPDGTSGDYFLIIESDFEYSHLDTVRENNVALLMDENDQPELLHITLRPSPDLVASAFEAPVSVYANAIFETEVCIQNQGTGFAGNSFNQIFLSPDPVISNHDLRLGSFNAGVLAADSMSCYTHSTTIPVDFNGNYYLIAQLDAMDAVYEHGGETNNITLRSIEVVTPLPSDLVIEDIVVPVEVIAGDVVEIGWSTQNIGPNPVYGGYREIVYLSADSTWSIADPVFGVKDTSGYIAPQAMVHSAITEQVKDVTEGDYYAIVRSDVQQQVVESSDANNTGISEDQMSVDLKTLVIDSLTHDSVPGGHTLYYKIQIPPAYENESLLVTLEGDSLSGRNELYLKFEGIATRADFEFGPQQATGPLQQVIVPEAQVGTYYITAYGSTDEGEVQNVELLAVILPFEILSIAPAKGVKDKKVTVAIRGAKLSDTDVFRLRQSQPWRECIAESVYTVNDNLVYATFDLSGMPVDTYQLDGIKLDNTLAIAPQDFMIIEEGMAELQFNVEGPTGFTTLPIPRRLTVTFINTGDADVENAILEVHAPYGNALSGALDELRNGMGSPLLELALQEANGPPGIIRPGAGGSIDMYFYAQPAPTFVFKLKDQE